MKTFIVSTENFIAKAIACKALKAVDTNETAHNLYKKACMGGKIVITNMLEMQTWQQAIKAYTPVNTSEAKVYRVLAANATRGLNKREDALVAAAIA